MAKRTNQAQTNQPVSAASVVEFETEVGGSELPTIDPTPKFVFTHHPDRWIILDGKLVPALSRFALVSGVNRVTEGVDGRVGFADARAKLEKENRRVVPQEWGPLDAGNGRKTYVQAVQTQSGATAYLSAWESWSPGSSTTWTDVPAYAEWLASIVGDGKLPPCSLKVAREMLGLALGRLSKAEAVASGLAKGQAVAAKERVAQLTVEAEVLRAYVGKADASAPRRKGPAVQVDVEE